MCTLSRLQTKWRSCSGLREGEVSAPPLLASSSPIGLPLPSTVRLAVTSHPHTCTPHHGGVPTAFLPRAQGQGGSTPYSPSSARPTNTQLLSSIIDLLNISNKNVIYTSKINPKMYLAKLFKNSLKKYSS